MVDRLRGTWDGVKGLGSRTYVCGFCGHSVAPDHGLNTSNVPPGQHAAAIRVCHLCNRPTFLEVVGAGTRQIPGVRPGDAIKHLPSDVQSIYDEARDAHAAGAYTAAVLLLRKLLMHVAVGKGAKDGLNFVAYVEYLDGEGYLGRDGKGWVDHVRKKGNEANHEIVLMAKGDSDLLMTFAEMLLKLVYELPFSLPQPPPTPTP